MIICQQWATLVTRERQFVHITCVVNVFDPPPMCVGRCHEDDVTPVSKGGQAAHGTR